MRWLFKPKKMAVLDVGSHTLKLAVFSFKKSKPFLDNFAFLPVVDKAIEQGDLTDPDPLKEALPDFISQNTTARPAVSELYVAMSGRSVIVKKLEVLRSEKDLLDDLMREEVRQNLPFNLNEINYDYAPMDKLAPADENKMNILIFAAKKAMVEKINDMIESAGYKCACVDMGALALSSALLHTEPDLNQKSESVLLLDIGKAGTGFMVLHQGQLIFYRYINVGSEFYTQNIMRSMNMEYQSGEALKFSWCSGTETPPEMRKIMEESDRYFCDEVFMGYEYFKNQFPAEKLCSAYITGGGAKIPSLISAVSGRFDIPAHLLSPFPHLPSSDVLQDSLEHIKHFIPVALGTCLNGYE